jgi:hypothetical protein
LSAIRILFYTDDFKTYQWGLQLERSGCEIVANRKVAIKYLNTVLKHAKTIIAKYFEGERVHVFVFRYLNDSQRLRKSLSLLFRDILTVIVCKVMNIRVIWLMHNVDKETLEHYPFITKIRRSLVRIASQRVLVTDPHLIDYAVKYGISKNKLDWICFGKPVKTVSEKKNAALKNQIRDFKNVLRKTGFKNILVGFCVSEPAQKKAHYTYAGSVAGVCKNREDTCVVLIMVGGYLRGEKHQKAKQRLMDSPYILLIDESFPVEEKHIADEIDFFYRSMTDQSVAYTLYVASNLGKPVITHNLGVLQDIVRKENIGIVIDHKETSMPDLIFDSIHSWNPEHAKGFLAKRSWKTGAERFLDNMYKTGLRPS